MSRPTVGRIGRAHGLKGEVQITSTAPDAVFVPGAVLEGRGLDLVVATARRHQARWLVRFEGIDDRTAAEALKGTELTSDPLDDDGPSVPDLVGREVVDSAGIAHGRITDILPNPAHDILVLDDDTLVPVVFVIDDTDPDRVVVDAPEGIFG